MYAVNCTFNETFMIDAADEDEARDSAITLMEDQYGLAPGQVEVDSIKKVS